MDFTNAKNFLDFMAAERTPGNAIVIYKDGKLAYHYASGYSDLEAKTPMTGKEHFYIYSCSKLTTVTAASQLLEQGKMMLSDPLFEYIPEFRHMNVKTPEGEIRKANRAIRVGDLFSMTAGFSYNLNAPGLQKARELTNGQMDTVETIKCLAEDPLIYDPGTKWEYSLAHDVLAALVSVISGQKFRDYVTEHIFKPLDMNESFYHVTPEIKEKIAPKYKFVSEKDADFDPVEAQKSGNAKEGIFVDGGKGNVYIFGPEYDSGGAGIITTAFDYAKLTAALANGGTGINGERILSPYTVDLMRTDRLTPQQKPYFSWGGFFNGHGYGLGVRTHTDPALSGSLANIGEFGWGGAAGSSVYVDPTAKLGVFYVQHCLNPRENFYQPRLRNVIYSCLDK